MLFQFHKVRLKAGQDRSGNAEQHQFQFHKVRLKVYDTARCTL